jgi:hypothetical protein
VTDPAVDQGAARDDSGPGQPTYRARLERTAQSVDQLRAALEDETEARDQLILEAIDAGHSRSEVARWSRVGRTRVTQIVAARALELQQSAAG